MGPHLEPRAGRGKRVRAAARFLSVYGRLPQDFDPDTAMGLMANIPAVEAAQALTFAKAIAIAFGDGKSQAQAVYDMTGNARLAQKIEVQARMQEGMNRG